MSDRKVFWIIFLLWGGALFTLLYFGKLITPFDQVSIGINYNEQIFYALVLAPYPAFLVFWTLRKYDKALAFQRILLCGAPRALVIFILQLATLVAFEISSKISIPDVSNLYNADLASQVSAFSRIPILSHFVAIYLFLGTYIARSVTPGGKRLSVILIGLAFYLPYLAGFVICHTLWQSTLMTFLVPPHKVNLFLLFVHWFPTVYFLMLTYIYSMIPKK
jgi:hypothetical protein